MMRIIVLLLLQMWAVLPLAARPAAKGDSISEVTITPAAPGNQLVRFSMPFLPGRLKVSETLETVDDSGKTLMCAIRPLSWYQAAKATSRSVRRALVTFPFVFKDRRPVAFSFRVNQGTSPQRPAPALPIAISLDKRTLTIAYLKGPMVQAQLVAPDLVNPSPPFSEETVESNPYFQWKRFKIADVRWPRVIEVRADVLGGVLVVAHLQRNLAGDGRAPDFGWQIETATSTSRFSAGGVTKAVASAPLVHPLTDGQTTELSFSGDEYRLYHPAAAFYRRGRVSVSKEGEQVRYSFLRCAAVERVPMQQSAWLKAEFVISRAGSGRLKPTLQYPNRVSLPWQVWDALYDSGPTPSLSAFPELEALARYHREAMIRAQLPDGDDWGNITYYEDDARKRAIFGMNRFNHNLPIFKEGYRCDDPRLVDCALLWCENFRDLSIWWGTEGRGGTRYNNVTERNVAPLDNDRTFMWRSNDAVSFCTKGFEAFFIAYEETGDPRMMEALEAQASYAMANIKLEGQVRNIGIVGAYVDLFKWTGDKKYLNSAVGLYQGLGGFLSPKHLFSQEGKPIEKDDHYIEMDDSNSLNHPFAKPYILGYALEGLPSLSRFLPQDKLLPIILSDMADFICGSQDPLGGWRYPHPRSSRVVLDQAMEHAWQLVQADLLLGPRPAHLEAMERVLRQRYFGWKETGKTLTALTGWELATHKVKAAKELYALYIRPEDRDPSLDYSQGHLELGTSSPEGIVYFPEVLAYYLKHRPANNILRPPSPKEPLRRVIDTQH